MIYREFLIRGNTTQDFRGVSTFRGMDRLCGYSHRVEGKRGLECWGMGFRGVTLDLPFGVPRKV